MLWNDIVKEVMDRKANGQKACLLNDEEREFSCIDTGKDPWRHTGWGLNMATCISPNARPNA